MKPRLFSVSALLLTMALLALPLLAARPARSTPASTSLYSAAANAQHPIHALYIYNQSHGTARSMADLLANNGVAVDTMPLNIVLTNRVYLPLVLKSGNTATVAQSAAQPGAIDLAQYDLIVLADDSGSGRTWLGSSALAQQIIASGRPVLGLGLGGALFFDQAQLAIGLSGSVQVSGSQVEPADGNSSRPFYHGHRPVATDRGPLTLYTSDQPTIAVLLGERQPKLTRLARLVGSPDRIPIVREGTRWALWGFRGAPGQLSATGKDLLVNLAWQLTVAQVEIPLATGALLPEPGVEPALASALAGGPQYALAQLYRLPTQAERQTLAGLGVQLLGYLANNTYSAQVAPTTNLNNPTLLRLVRFLGSYRPEYKVDPQLAGPQAAAAASYKEVAVNFFANVPRQMIQTILQKTAGAHYRQLATPREWLVPNDPAMIAALAQEPAVRFIGVGFVPFQELNDEGRASTHSDDVQQAIVPQPGTGDPISYLGLTGQGVTIGHMEAEPDTTHPDLNGRAIIGAYAYGSSSSHATHTAGTVIGSGGQSEANGGAPFQWRGHAPRAHLVNEGPGTDPNADTYYPDYFSDAILNYEAAASTHSYVMAWGTYDNVAAGIDTIVRGDATDSDGNLVPARLALFAVANQGTDPQYDDEVGFYSIYAPAKNSLGVGSIDTDTTIVSSFSSRGPTFDGRIKPDIVAPGCRNYELASKIISTIPGGGYDGKCGTSMATPAAAGVVALMMEQYHNTFGSLAVPLPSSLKALLVNTATDLSGTTNFNDPDCGCTFTYGAGPDWATGYGLINAEAAVAAIRAKSIVEDQVEPGNAVDTYTFEVTAGHPDLRFTLAWDDEPGEVVDEQDTPKLTNNLDLLLIAPDGVTLHYPWVLDPLPMTDNPGDGALDPIDQDDIDNNPAYPGINTRDNVEQVLVENPAAGTWMVQVTAAALPNNNAQKYSLAGDLRQFEIVDPQGNNAADAGDPANPNTIRVVLEARQPYAADENSSLIGAEASDFSVTLDGNGVAAGTSANIISGLVVGDQFWLNVRPQSGVYASDERYDLTVNWNGYGADTEAQAVRFSDREVTDRAIVLDHSGSMADYDKMNAALNAARLFIDQSLIGDRIAVVGFSTTASTPYPINEVSADPAQPELAAAKAAVDNLTPTNMTAIGLGLLAGQDEVTAAPAGFSAADVLVLLSDGMENVDPLYDTPAVRGMIEPTDTIIHTVAVGPSNAGHHQLLDTIATDNHGLSYVVTNDADGMAAAAAPHAASTLAVPAIGLNAWPQTLANRLGDAYKAIAEEVLHENRLFQAQGLPDATRTQEQWRIVVPERLRRITFAVNWALPSTPMRLVVRDPAGKEFSYNPQNPSCRTNATHQTCIIDTPLPGTWLITLVFGGNSSEYMVWASAKTSIAFQLFVGTPEPSRIVHQPIHLLGFLTQGGRPLANQQMTVQIRGPRDGGPLRLFDDGKHDDGAAKDGVYGGYVVDSDVAGIYAVRGQAEGHDLSGRPFQLLRNTSFHLRPRAAYIYRSDPAKGADYRRLLQGNGIAVDLINVNNVPATRLQDYNLLIVGPDTGLGASWGTPAALEVIRLSGRPVLGLGEGGYACFGQLRLNIGYPYGAHGTGTAITWGSASDDIWVYSHEFQLPVGPLPLYQTASRRVDILLRSQFINLQVFGYNNLDRRYAELVIENSQHMLWGFNDGPRAMTLTGRRLFINTAYRTIQ